MGKWAGVFVIALWLITTAIGLTMMWDRDWMESNPPAEILTMGVHMIAAIAGAALGLMLLAPKIRNSLTLAQRATWLVSALLAIVTATRLF